MRRRAHDRSHFFKYSSYKTAKVIIENKSFQWSSPTNFNDPFDHQSGFAVDIEPEEFANLLMDSVERVVFSDIDVHTEHSKLAQLSLLMRSIRDHLPRKKFHMEMYEASLESAQNLVTLMDQFSEAIHKHLCHSRIFCVSERGDNVVMWSHYADEHRGVVFKLRCLEDIDNALLMARPVSYTNSFVPFLSSEEYAKHLTGERPVDMAELCWDIAFTKHADWSYEKEWRVHLPLLDQPASDGYSVFEEDDRVFEAVYLGCRMKDQQVSELVELTRRYMPDTRVFRARKDSNAFALAFEEVNETKNGAG